jgi:hypothetical protein
MLSNIIGRVDDTGDTIPVSFHKVKAHTGVIGNERAKNWIKPQWGQPCMHPP